MKSVLIIGNGISGLSCAVTLGHLGIRTYLTACAPPERAQSVMAAGGINAVRSTPDSIECHINDTIKGGCFIEDYEAVKGLCTGAPAVVEMLERIGVVFSRNEDGSVARRAFGGQTYPRTAFSGASTGKQIVSALIRQARRYEYNGIITTLNDYYFHSALIKDGKCYGALLLNKETSTLEPFYTDDVVIATGGQNQLFGKTTGSRASDGYATGKLFEQGVKLRNLEFIQYHPTTIETPQKRMLISEAARGEGGRLYYLDGDKRVYFMEDLYGERGNLMPRDIVSRCIYNAPSQVYLDIAFLGKETIVNKLFEIYDICNRYINLDVTKQSIPVAPSVHFFMGGIAVDNNHQTNIEHLYAVGECASIYHGANRLGGNSLLAAVYSGSKAGININETSAVTEQDLSAYVNDCRKELEAKLSTNSKFPAFYIKSMLAKTMNESMGIIRTGEGLKEGISSIDYYIDICRKLRYDPDISVYNTYNLSSMLTLAKASIVSADARKESRGAHFRSDYPDTLDSYKYPSIAEYNSGEIKITFNGREEP